jgi:hypothetical protein
MALEHAEDQSDLKPQSPVHSGDTEGGCRSQVVEAYRQRDQE